MHNQDEIMFWLAEFSKQLKVLRERTAEEKQALNNDEVVAHQQYQIALDIIDETLFAVHVTPEQAKSGRTKDVFQNNVQPWMLACFGEKIAGDVVERNHRFFEEATELVQACGMSCEDAHQLVDYTYGRPIGEKSQEVGGVMVTLAALCLAQKIDMHDAAETELARIWTKVDVIRAKQASKPQFGPLAEVVKKSSADDLHGAIMNLQANTIACINAETENAYKAGHKEARHAAAELAVTMRDKSNWCAKCGCGNDQAGYGHLQNCPDDVKAALDRMCSPIDPARVDPAIAHGATAVEDGEPLS